MVRPSYADSIRILDDRVGIIGDALPSVDRVPRHDDDIVGPGIFRTRVEDVSLAGLTLSGLYVSRSLLSRISFAECDLRLAAFNWNGVADCDFEGADFAGADLRACEFVRCSFRRASLSDVDLRCSTFRACRFDDANLAGARLYRLPGLLGLFPRLIMVPRLGFQADPRLTPAQRAQVRWCRDAPVPAGG
jgi:pentapeptide repeat protein